MDSHREFKRIPDSSFQHSPLAKLFQLGRMQSYLTYDDILQYFPCPEQDLAQLERVFAALLCVGIPYGEDADTLDERDIDESLK